MNTPLKNIKEVLVTAENSLLYTQLITQLNKDLNLAGVSISIPSTLSSKELQENIYAIVTHLINTNFEGFLSLLYRIDLPESKIKNLPKTNFDDYIKTISYLILKRVWKKVWWRNKYA